MPRRGIPPASPSSDPRSKWRKKKRKRDTGKDSDSDSDSGAGAAGGASPSGAPAVSGGGGVGNDPLLDLRESEVVSGGAQKICDFPMAVKRTISRPHHSVLSVVAAERSLSSGLGANVLFVENVSHGQLQSLSAVAAENLADDKPPVYVCTPPQLMEGKGVVLKFEGDRVLVVPAHSEWFSPTTVHRLERQVVPHFFSGKSPSHTPEKYVSLRNKIISKYLDNPTRRLAFGECQSLVSSNTELYDLSRIVRFLDNWGIINYLAIGSVHRGLRMAASLLKEDPATGELQLVTAPLKSIDSLMLFDRPKCSLKTEELASLVSSSSGSNSGLLDLDNGLADLDGKIRQKISDNSCSYCSVPLPGLHYRSQKEDDVALCLNCFHDSKYITGHSSLDFIRADSKTEPLENENNNWTDQETLMLLEGIEKYNDRWNEIAEHVGTKSKAQCIQHFIRLPVEDGLLENIDVPEMPQADVERQASCSSYIPNGDTSGTSHHDDQAANKFPFADAPNPVMSLVAFIASAIGPRVAAACANTALCVLTKEDSRSNSDGTQTEADTHGSHLHNNGDRSTDNSPSPLSPEGVKYAAKCGLSAAAVKAKLFADQEEREIQRLSATIINHQLKRLELKLKQFAEIETLLLKECEHSDKMRQRIHAERVHMMTTGRVRPPLTTTGPIPNPMPNSSSMPTPTTTGTGPMSPNPNRAPQTMAASHQTMQQNMSPMQQAQLQQLMQRQQQMLSFGPRLPLSAIHPNLNAGPAQNAVFNSATGVAPNHPNHPLNHPMLRPSGNNSNVG